MFYVGSFSSDFFTQLKAMEQDECTICEAILEAFNPHEQAQCISLWSMANLLQSPCKDHKTLILSALRTDKGAYNIQDYFTLTFFQPNGSGQVFFQGDKTTGRNSCLSSGFRLISVPDRPNGRLEVSGLKVHPEWIDESLPRRWKDYCNHGHRGSCKKALTAAPVTARPLLLIDTQKKCLVRPSDEVPYVALSYVWGRKKMLECTDKNLPALLRVNSLSPKSHGASIPQTIQDAIAWTQVLGERFLWVDSLCIKQGSDGIQTYLSQMSDIYANASVTIVAAQGPDAQHGLKGLQGKSDPRNFQQKIFPIKAARVSESIFPLKDNSHNPWETRGWTFQEHLFSRRRLVFEADCVRWECPGAVWYEEEKCNETMNPIQNNLGPIVSMQAIFSCPFSDVLGLVALLCHYNSRELTYPQDALNAFSGTAYAFRTLLPGAFISGLPEAFFDIALLWRGKQPLRRRRSKFGKPKGCLPSWSWAGWQGDLSEYMWTEATEWVKYSSYVVVSNAYAGSVTLTHWKYIDPTSTNFEGIPIKNYWSENKSRYASMETTPCPRGWTRQVISASEKTRESWNSGMFPGARFFFTHQSEPDALTLDTPASDFLCAAGAFVFDALAVLGLIPGFEWLEIDEADWAALGGVDAWTAGAMSLTCLLSDVEGDD
ncbi:heterokaryon incompatibility protein-domain-containing protein [Xylariales sp. PMI_506]|nr:heterokaryon incompatibility protein-domain-containing protein [Xylariales sp. PMI_506]